MLARLQHPNIVQIHDIGEQAGQPFLVMEYLAGGDLEEYLHGQPLPPRRAAELLVPLAEAIDAAHRAGIVHRDLKPGNILLAGEGPASPDHAAVADPVPPAGARHPLAGLVPKITDFGLAKQLEEEARMTQSGLVVGTPSYMAPEQADAACSVGPAVDLWRWRRALRVPDRPTTLSRRYARPRRCCKCFTTSRCRPRACNPASRAIWRPSASSAWRRSRRGVTRRPGTSSMTCGGSLRGEPIRARRAKPWQVAWKWARRKPAAAALAGRPPALALVGLPLVTALWLQADRQRQEKEQERDRANTARNELERAVYAGRIVLAQKAYQDNDIDNARTLLDRRGPSRAGPTCAAGSTGICVSSARRTCTPACATRGKAGTSSKAWRCPLHGRRGHRGRPGHRAA